MCVTTIWTEAQYLIGGIAMDDLTRERILKGASLKYDDLYQRASEVVRKVNPCRIKDGKCRAGLKIESGLCCNGCKHLGPDGCTTQALGCKMYLCYFGGSVRSGLQTKKNSKIVERYFRLMAPILEEAKEFGITDGRSTKEELINWWLRNTLDMEERAKGILSEAGMRFHIALKANPEVKLKWRSNW